MNFWSLVAEINLFNMPEGLMQQLNIDLFSAQILASMIVLAVMLFPTLILSKGNVVACVIVGVPTMLFTAALGWTPIWVLLVTCVLVGLMFSGGARTWLSGRGNE